MSTSMKTITRFTSACLAKYQGVTQTEPMGPVPYRGAWQQDQNSNIEIDKLTQVIILVPLAEAESALIFLEGWQKKLSKILNQTIILVTYHPVQTLGEFVSDLPTKPVI